MNILEILYFCLQVVCSVVVGTFLGLIFGGIAFFGSYMICLIMGMFLEVLVMVFGKDTTNNTTQNQ